MSNTYKKYICKCPVLLKVDKYIHRSKGDTYE